MRWDVVPDKGGFKGNDVVRFTRDYDGTRAGTFAKIVHPMGPIIGDPCGRLYTLVMVEVPMPRGLAGVQTDIPEVRLFTVPEEVLERMDPT
jgi:hypothetical protein